MLQGIHRSSSWFRGNAFRKFRAEEKPSGTREKPAVLQSQRDCVFQPRVARNELPWVSGRMDFNPNGVVSRLRRRAATPLGLFAVGHVSQGSSFLTTLGYEPESLWDSSLDIFPSHQGRVVNFTDPQLQKCYDRNFAEAAESSGELRQVAALIAAHDVFRLMEGPHSPRVHEAIEHILLPTLRPVLRRWYQRADAEMNPAAIEFRDHLSQLAGERL